MTRPFADATAACALVLLAVTSTPRVAAAAPRWLESTERLGARQPCFDVSQPNLEGCYSSYVALADLDADGHLDIVFASGGGYFVPATTAPLAVYRNDGKGAFLDLNAAAFGGFEGRVRQVTVGDIDGDGDLDVYVPDGYGLQSDALFVNDGKSPPSFTNEAATRLPVSSHAGAVRFGDVDGDGALDIVVADWGAHPPTSHGVIRVYLNDRAGHFHEKAGAAPETASSRGSGPVDLDLFDADGDLVLDILVAHRKGGSELLRGDGTGAFATDAAFPRQPGPYSYGPDVCDVDGDGDLDVWLDNAGRGHTEELLINDGKGHFQDETAERVHGNPAPVDDNVVKCADVNGDGAFDLVIGSLSGDRRVLLNDGRGHFTLEEGTFPAQKVSTLGLDLGDLDGDGRLDVVTAQGEKGPFLNRVYLATAEVPPDIRPPSVRQLEKLGDGTPRGVAIVRFAVADNVTTDTGPRLKSATLERADKIIPAVFVGGDLFRAVLPVDGARVTYRACATDWAGNHTCSDPVSFAPREGEPRASSCTPLGLGQQNRRSGCGIAAQPSPDLGTPAALSLVLAVTFLRRRRRRASLPRDDAPLFATRSLTGLRERRLQRAARGRVRPLGRRQPRHDP